jgi:hypothetical protein
MFLRKFTNPPDSNLRLNLHLLPAMSSPPEVRLTAGAKWIILSASSVL